MRGVLAALLRRVLALALVGFARPVGACSCAEPDSVIPRDGAIAPTNTRIWIPPFKASLYWWRLLLAEKRRASSFEDEPPKPEELSRALKLVGPLGELVEFEVTDIGVGSIGLFFVVIPRVELEPGPYELGPSTAVPTSDRRFGRLTSRFTVVDTRIETPPAVPKVTLGEWHQFPQERETMCSATGLVDLNVEHDGWLLVYQIYDPKKKPDPDRIDYAIMETTSFVVGDGACSPYWRFDGGPALVRFGSIDLRGKFSGFGSPIPLDPPWPRRPMKALFPKSAPPPRGCGCRVGSHAGEEATAGVFVVLVGLLLGSRRGRDRRDGRLAS